MQLGRSLVLQRPSPMVAPVATPASLVASTSGRCHQPLPAGTFLQAAGCNRLQWLVNPVVTSATAAAAPPQSGSTNASSNLAPSSNSSPSQSASVSGKVLLQVSGLEAKVVATGQQILRGVDLVVREGEVHAIMGKNGSGKSTLSKVLVGHPDYEVTAGSATFKGQDLFALEPEERSHAGLFLSFQTPIEVPGVSNVDFLRMACNARRKSKGQSELDPLEFYAHVMPKLELLNMDPTFLNRNVNEGFSGGEKKRNEILQLAVLEAEMAILDEIDSGLDIDALRDVAKAVNTLKRADTGVLMVTHYKRLLDYIKPDFVHIMQAGSIVKTGDMGLVDQLESQGYAFLEAAPAAL